MALTIRSTQNICFDPDGDRMVIVGTSPEMNFQVSSKVMSLCCTPWKVMLNSGFAEANAERPIIMPDDDPEAMKILLAIAHMKYEMVPEVLEYQDLANLAMVLDKYQAVHLVRPWATRWIEELEGSTTGGDAWEWVWISWTFGLPKIFEEVAQILLIHSGRGGYQSWKSGTRETISVPPRLEESIESLYSSTVERVLAAWNSELKRYEDAILRTEASIQPICKVAMTSGLTEKTQEYHATCCDVKVYGAMLIWFKKQKVQLDSPGDWSDALALLQGYISAMENDVRKLVGISYDRNLRPFTNGVKSNEVSEADRHRDCVSFAKLWPFYEEIYRLSPVLDSHRVHMERQALACPIKNGAEMPRKEVKNQWEATRSKWLATCNGTIGAIKPLSAFEKELAQGLAKTKDPKKGRTDA